MKYLAIDLAWSGPSGWVLWDDDRSDAPVLALGQFQPAKNVIKQLTGATRTLFTVRQIRDEVARLLTDVDVDLVIYEITDWFQHLNPNDPKLQILYARERQTQRCLGRAEAALLSAIPPNTYLMHLGAAEAKADFGVRSKADAARLLAAEYPEQLTYSGNELVYLVTNRVLSHHISDAMVLAKVGSNRWRTNKLIEEAA